MLKIWTLHIFSCELQKCCFWKIFFRIASFHKLSIPPAWIKLKRSTLLTSYRHFTSPQRSSRYFKNLLGLNLETFCFISISPFLKRTCTGLSTLCTFQGLKFKSIRTIQLEQYIFKFSVLSENLLFLTLLNLEPVHGGSVLMFLLFSHPWDL